MLASPRALASLALALVLGAAAGCNRGAPAERASRADAPAAVPEHAADAPEKAPEKKKFGSAITETSSTALDALVREPERFAAKTVRTEGKVSAVCQHAGCWMEISDASGKAHVKMAGHAFTVPRDSAGHHAVIQGKVIAPDKDHCTEEAAEQTGSVAKIEIEASGVELVD
jgi:hypothetical protein